MRILSMCVVSAAVMLDHAVADEPVDPAINEMLAAHNFLRKQRKLEPLKLSVTLCESAKIHARDMANRERMSHAGSDGSNPIQRARRAGYGSSWVGENVAVSQWTVEQVMMEWMESRGHRANILGKYTEMGAACVEDEIGNYFWCVNFGDPRHAMPKSEAILKPEEASVAVVKQINRDRQAGQMVLLHPEATLRRAAMALSAAMAAKDSLEVDDDPLKLVDEKTRQGRQIRVRFAANARTPERAARELVGPQADELHRFREIGVGFAVAKSGTPYWCAILAEPAEVEEHRLP